MWRPDSSAIDAALVERLQADATLRGYLPDGIYFDMAPPNSQRFGIVSLIEQADHPTFAGRAIEEALYLVKAVVLSTSGADIKAAAARMDALLEDEPLAVPGFSWMTVHRAHRIRLTEVDDLDTSIRWQHRGGQYRVQFSIAEEGPSP